MNNILNQQSNNQEENKNEQNFNQDQGLQNDEKNKKKSFSNKFKEFWNNFNKNKALQILKYLGILLLILPILFILLVSSYLLDIKQSYQYALAAKNDLEAAIELAQNLDFENTLNQSSQANHNFSLSINKIKNVEDSFLIKLVPYFSTQIKGMSDLLETGVLVSNAVNETVKFSREIQIILENNNANNLSSLSSNKKAQILDKVLKSEERFAEIQEKIVKANKSIQKIETTGALWLLKDKVNNLKTELEEAENIINKTVPLTKILPALVGYPDKARYLVLLQNSDRLRPIGGTIGTYGIVEMNKGEIVSYELYDTNYLDKLTKYNNKIEPPATLKKLTKVNTWNFRDANWSPDWTMSSKQIEWLFRTKLLGALKNSKNNECPIADCNLNFDGVIGITPELAIDLLAVIGSVNVNGVEYNKNNFISLYEEELDKTYLKTGKQTNKKLLINKITKAIHLKIFDLPFSSWPELGGVLAKNADNKNILIYSKNNELENLLKKQNWAGELKTVIGDYLMITDTNIPATRLNRNVDEYAYYEVKEENNKLIANLTLKYNYIKNNENKKYKNYVRVFAPLGSKLISSSVSLNKIKATNELGKTSFGTYFEIWPGTSHELKLSYELPSLVKELSNKEKYSLYVQKQPGNTLKELVVFANLENNITKITGKAFYSEKLSDTKVSWKTDLSKDRQFEAIITK